MSDATIQTNHALSEEFRTERTDAVARRTELLFGEHQGRLHRRIDHMFAWLMLFQWILAVAAALWLTPLTWSGAASQIHAHVWSALFLGGIITVYPVFLTWRRPGAVLTRHAVAAGQLLMSALLIHLAGGRIETHFHVFGSLAFLAFYRDWRVLITAAAITAADHFLRGLLFPQSVYGIQTVEIWRWLEHAAWVVFEVFFLIVSCQWGLRELHGICDRDAMLEANNADLEQKVEARTALLAAANARLETLATTDPLTNLPNHRALVDILDKEMERSHRYNRPCSVLFLDLDHFKALNDTCGHAAGDAALQQFAEVTRTVLRAIDTLGRWGGEEFVALLPETDLESATVLAERLRSAVAAQLFPVAGGVYLTCSIGVAAYPICAPNRSEVIAVADRAMYAAKQMGRNQVRSAADPIVETLTSRSENSREEMTLQGTVEALASLVEARDAYTGEHTDGVARLAMHLANAMGLDTAEMRLVGLIGKLHDIGKVAIPDAILHKQGSLVEEEWARMRKHPIIGADVVSHVPTLRIAAPGIRAHHERWDGKGYPDGLAGESIPLPARIVAVADAYRTILTGRHYRQARSDAEALRELKRCAGTQFDPNVVHTLETLPTEEREERCARARIFEPAPRERAIG